MKTKKARLQPFEVCEFAKKCKEQCNGKNANRECEFSCALRRILFTSRGIKVEW